MAKPIPATPVLSGPDAERIQEILCQDRPVDDAAVAARTRNLEENARQFRRVSADYAIRAAASGAGW